MHQETDLFQTVHAGLWRGIFTHKQGLGTFAGIATGLLLFYGRVAFSSSIVWICALACCATCLWATKSVTGFLGALVLTISLYVTYWASYLPRSNRQVAICALIFGCAVIMALFSQGFFDFLPELFGKSTDLSGRSNYWSYLLARLEGSGRMLLGGGLRANFVDVLIPGFGVDNGYMNLLVEFGLSGHQFCLVFTGGLPGPVRA